MRSVSGALSWFDAHSHDHGWERRCEEMARTAYGLGAHFATAALHFAAVPASRRHGHTQPPAGALVIYRNNGAGHIVVATGHGWACWTNDSPDRRGTPHVYADARDLAPWCHAAEWYACDPWWSDSAALRLSWTRPAAPPFPGTVRQGSTGSAVRAWQNEMIRRGRIADNAANRDGVFGPGMARAVRALQTAERIAVDGVAGPQTWTALTT
jgi:hypothetical protein